MRHTLSILLRNESIALARLTSLLATRGYRIHSISGGPMPDPDVSQLVLVIDGAQAAQEQIVLQVRKLIDVFEVELLGVEPL